MSAGEGRSDPRGIEELIDSLAGIDPPFSSLGTAFLADTEVTDALVRHGHAAVAPLEVALASADPRIAMYAAYCLGQIGDRGAIPALRAALGRSRDKPAKEAFDFSVESAVTGALARLGEVP